jgi:hypothetical protein
MPVRGTPRQKAAQIMREFKAGELHSGKGGPVVTDPKQARAIVVNVSKPKKKQRKT